MPVTSNSWFARAIPRALVAFRTACAPLIVILAWQLPSREPQAVISAAGFVSHVFDACTPEGMEPRHPLCGTRIRLPTRCSD